MKTVWHLAPRNEPSGELTALPIPPVGKKGWLPLRKGTWLPPPHTVSCVLAPGPRIMSHKFSGLTEHGPHMLLSAGGDKI